MTLLKRLSSTALHSHAKVTLQTIRKMYRNKEPLTMLTAHDYPSGIICEKAGVDICLVGDSLAMVCLGYDSTTEITLQEMIHHSKAVHRGSKRAFLVGDMPFGSYEKSPEHTLDSAVEFMKKGQVEAVKMEGGMEILEHVRKLAMWGIPVVGHIGLTPQRAAIFGGYKVQGKTAEKASEICQEAQMLQDAGACMIVLEAVPFPVAKFITESIQIPTIGIGAGPFCSGQVLVQLDALGMYDRHLPKFCKVFSQIGSNSVDAIKEYCRQVKTREFPSIEQHCYPMKSEQELETFERWTESLKKSTDL